jgi:hypothetical protein
MKEPNPHHEIGKTLRIPSWVYDALIEGRRLRDPRLKTPVYFEKIRGTGEPKEKRDPKILVDEIELDLE